MSDAEVPDIEFISSTGRVDPIGKVVDVHVEPLYCSASPPSFTDQTSVVENAAMGPNSTELGTVM